MCTVGGEMPRIESKAPVIVAFVAIVVSTGCISALREPPPLEEMAASAREQGGNGRFAEAERLWSQRTLDSVQAAAQRYQASITDDDVQLEALLGATRARIWIADHHEDPDVRLAEAEEAIALGQWCGRVEPEEAECDYLLALGLGLQARERKTTAIDGLPRVIELLQFSVERAPTTDNAGPHRVLALLYMRAPGWPTGPGAATRVCGDDSGYKVSTARPEHAG